MLPLITTAIGAILGGLTAFRRKGNGFDIAQWAAVWALIGMIIGIIGVIIIPRL